MTIRVAHFGTGNVGQIALRQLIVDPRFELTAVWVSSDAKAGRDAGELAGLAQRTGIEATTDWDAVVASAPHCAVYCAMGDDRVLEAVDDLRRLLDAGLDVVSSTPTVLQYPFQVLPRKYLAPLEQAAERAGKSVFVNGVDPGFTNDILPIALAGTCQSVEQIRCLEIADYATYDGATVMFDVMGFGSPPGEVPPLLQPGVLSMAWGSAIRAMAGGLGITLDGVTDSCELEPAPEAFDITAGRIPKGGLAAIRFEVSGMVDGRAVLVVEHVTRLREDLRPDWAQPGQAGGSYRIEIVGEPAYRVEVLQTSKWGDHNYSAIAAGAGRIVNAIPAVVAAPAGVRTALDLPLATGSGSYGVVMPEPLAVGA